MTKAILKARDLCKTFMASNEGANIIKNVNFDLYEGDFTVIMGPSGSGKSTLLYLLSGMDGATAGDIHFEDRSINNLKEKDMVEFRRKKIGFVFQAINLVPNISIFENVIMPGYLISRDRKNVDKRAGELLDLMELSEHKDKLPSMVSGGQQQRAAIARALINSPKVVFADEPTGSLNSAQGQNVLDILTGLNNNGQSIVMVTHDVKAAARANRVLFLKDGRLEGDFRLDKYTGESVEERERTIFSYLTEKGW